MGSIPDPKLLFIDFSGTAEPGTAAWANVRAKVWKALEEFGCFEARFDRVPLGLRNGTLGALKEIFDLPVLTDEKRWASEETQARMRVVTARYFNRRVNALQFFVGKMVMRKNEFALQDKINKLSPKWEGLYKIVAVPHPNAYVLENTVGKKLPRTFNAYDLKKFYS